MTKPFINEKILWIYKLLLKNARHRSGGFSFKNKGEIDMLVYDSLQYCHKKYFNVYK